MRNRREWILRGALVVASVVKSQHAGAAPNCTDLTKSGLFPNTVVQTAVVVPADAKTGMPTDCEATAIIAPVPGSKVAAVYRLPENWNRPMLGLGGGGWAGILNLLQPAAISGPFRAASPGLTRG